MHPKKKKIEVQFRYTEKYAQENLLLMKEPRKWRRWNKYATVEDAEKAIIQLNKGQNHLLIEPFLEYRIKPDGE